MSVTFKHKSKGFKIEVQGKRGNVAWTKKGFAQLQGCNYNGISVITDHVLNRDFEKVAS